MHIWSLPEEFVIFIQLFKVYDEAGIRVSLIIWHFKHHVLIVDNSFSTDTGFISLWFFGDIIDLYVDVLPSFSCFAKAKMIFFPYVNSFLPSSPKVVDKIKPDFVLEMQ